MDAPLRLPVAAPGHHTGHRTLRDELVPAAPGRSQRPHLDPTCHGGRADFTGDDVVLLDPWGRPTGTASKSEVHGFDTPLHLACSCYVVDRDGGVLMTRRARSKRTFPCVWTNSCCGHPRPDETVEDAVRRHLLGELGLRAESLTCVLPDFTYRAVAADGIVEHEVCPVFVAEVSGEPELNPLEVDAFEWIGWTDLVARAAERPGSLSPWAGDQIRRLARLTTDLRGVGATKVAAPALRSAPVADPFEVGAAVGAEMAEFLAHRRAEAVGLTGLAEELVDAVNGLVDAGGKRVRPTFVCWGFLAAGHDSAGPAMSAAAAVEMLHTFALIHDDVMDGAVARRGRDTLHVGFAGLPAPARWTPDTRRRFGESAALLAGDLAFAWAHQLLDRAVDGADDPAQVRSVFATLCNEVVVGQYLDVRLTNAPCDDSQAAAIALLKSGRYTVTRPLELGATLGGADRATIDRLLDYGDAAGVAFQLRDDVLGVFGDDVITGKSCSDDLRDGKASLLLVRAMELATPAGREVLDRHLGDARMDAAAADRCRDVVLQSGALASVERLIAAKRDAAHAAADTLAAPVSHALHHMAVALTERAA